MDSGRCYSCASAYGVVRKEVGCKNCGFSFCTKCVTKKAAVKKYNNEVHKVCDKCYVKLTGDPTAQPQPRPLSPPANFIKRMQRLEDGDRTAAIGQKPTAPARSAVARPLPVTAAASAPDPDAELRLRLERLKEGHGSKGNTAAPTDEAIHSRLAALQGRTSAVAVGSRPQIYPKKTETQQTEDLLDEIFNEVDIENRHNDCSACKDNNVMDLAADTPGVLSSSIPSTDSLSDVAQLIASVAEELKLDQARAKAAVMQDKLLLDRLRKLQEHRRSSDGHQREDTEVARSPEMAAVPLQQPGSTDAVGAGHGGSRDTGDESEEEEVRRVLKQILEAKVIDDAVAADGFAELLHTEYTCRSPAKSSDHGVGARDPDELPWCCLCTADADLCCRECDGDLYCKPCFRRAHEDRVLKHHMPTPFFKHGSDTKYNS